MPLPAGLAAFAASHPQLWGIIQSLGIRGLTALGGYGITKLVGSPEEEALKKNLSVIGRLQPEYLNLLQKQMAGQPTAASAAIRGQVAQTSRAGQQSLAASSRRAGQGGTEVARANQARFLAAMAAEEQRQLGEFQLSAQQQVGALTGEARQVQAALAAQEGQELQQLTAYLAQGVFDDEIRRLMQQIVDAYTKQAGQGAATTAAQGWQPAMTPSMERRQWGPTAITSPPEIPLEEGGQGLPPELPFEKMGQGLPPEIPIEEGGRTGLTSAWERVRRGKPPTLQLEEGGTTLTRRLIENVEGLQPNWNVYMDGRYIGRVSDVVLPPTGKHTFAIYDLFGAVQRDFLYDAERATGLAYPGARQKLSVPGTYGSVPGRVGR